MEKRILIVNKFYYNRGGDCVCTINLETLLKSKGYKVMVYAMDYSENNVTEDATYFASNVDFSGGIAKKIKAAKRIFGLGDVVSSFKKVLDKFNPDVVHVQNIHSYLSPVVAKLAKAHGCRVVWTLHDYKLICPSYSCLNHGVVCEQCFNDNKSILRSKCLKNSMIASILAYAEALKWDRKALESFTDSFVCPSKFMMLKMQQAKYDKGKLYHICNFIDPVKANILDNIRCTQKSDYYVYVGRLSEEKGVRTLLDVASKLPCSLKIAGGGPLMDELKCKYKTYDNIQFLGHLNAIDVSGLITNAKFSVIPSEWYENNPLSVIESLYAGTPVVGANIGGIPELLSSENGISFVAGDKESMSFAIEGAYNKDWNYALIKHTAQSEFSSEHYFNKIMDLYFH